MFNELFTRIPVITPEELKEKIDTRSDVLVLDVREPHEVAFARIDGTTHIPMREIPYALDRLSKEEEIAVLCHTGVRSGQVARYLIQQDFKNVRNVEGGIDAWSRTVDPAVPRYR